MLDLWKELIPNLLRQKEPVQFENINLEYSPYIVNRALSYYMDIIFLVAEMNRNPHLGKKIQYDFLFNSIKKRYRPYTPWIKKEQESDDLKNIKELYTYSNRKAQEMINILTKDQLEIIRKQADKGGK